MLHEISDFIDNNSADKSAFPSYYYEGICPQTGELLRLPRTRLSEAIAQGLMQQLAKDERYFCEGKMYGILLVELPNGKQRVLKAFSGLLNAQSQIEGWVPPISGREKIALEETRTLTELETIKQELIRLKNLPEREEYKKVFDQFEQQLSQLTEDHQICKKQRQEKRALLCQSLSGEALNLALEELTKESQLQGIERRKFKQNQNLVLQPIKQKIEAAEQEISELKKQRKILSRQLQSQMHLAYSLTNFSGQTLSLQELMPVNSIPTGTGDCCAPKLLNYAAKHNLKPLAMAEFWWGAVSANQDKIQGQFYGACAERCQPIMGFLLSGLNSQKSSSQLILSPINLPVIYEDEWLIAINKPSGLLSVPGRYSDKQDSVLSRLRHLLSDGNSLFAVHRLDQQTSGILLFARSLEIYRQISRQFQNRQVEKIYEAILTGTLQNHQGLIDLPLWGDPQNRPYQKVDIEHGKLSFTKFRVIEKLDNKTRVEFFPLTGRTHQLRVHSADFRGLGMPILGDFLYGYSGEVSRLHLHARELRFEHPQLKKIIHLQTTTPF
ncbi:pseudouridine synthase [Ancylothrix sp. C2]|nr:pseudouridine synthase [Ancylothrix sp. D3o]MCT7952360.1 pseudouridine synthase [Ancylothrix sp. D3o]